MCPDSILVLGGAGFIGSALARRFRREWPSAEIVAFDNLRRRGSESNLAALGEAGVRFISGDIRNPEDLDALPDPALIIDCSAEPSVLAALEAPRYVLNANLAGTTNVLEFARSRRSALLFLSTSRVYPLKRLDAMPFVETDTRFDWSGQTTGITARGVSEDCPTDGPCSLYGASKLASEILIREYGNSFGIPWVVNRCGVIAGPGQFGKLDQGVFTFWLLAHLRRQPLRYIGFSGSGKQLRDLLHIADLEDLATAQILDFEQLSGQTFNVGGSRDASLSLLEATALCRDLTGNAVPVEPEPGNRRDDIRIYLSDCSRVAAATGWRPKRTPREILADTLAWLATRER